MWNPYLCRECFKKKYRYTDEMLDRAVREKRCPEWEYAQSGRKPVCGQCGKEGIVYG